VTTTLDQTLSHRPRLEALRATALLDSGGEEAFDRLTRLATRVLHVPVALVSLVEEDRQFFKSCVGLPEPWASARETPLSHSFCQHAVSSRQPLVISDAREHPLVRDNLAISDLSVVAYAGIPLITSDGHALGSFCVIDSEPREWSADDLSILRDLAANAMTEIELRIRAAENERLSYELAAERDRLRFDRDRLHRLLERLQQGVLTIDSSFRVRFANAALRGLAGFEDVAEGVPMPEPWPPLSLRSFAAPLFGRDAHETHTTVAADGRVYSVAGLPAGEGDEAIVVFMDTSARDRREQREREFVANAAHELQTPLTAITSAIEVLQSGAKDVPEDRELFLGDIERECARLRRLFRALLVLAESETRDGPPPATHIELRPLLAEVASGLRPAEGVEVHVECAEGAHIVANHDLLEHALLSLAANAVKYTRSGSIVLEASGQDERVAICIHDSGPGLGGVDTSRIFERFYRGEEPTGDGFGLGLSVARQAVEALGGALELESRGAGTTACVLLPLDRASE
jgi:signal transduction histidine kinase